MEQQYCRINARREDGRDWSAQARNCHDPVSRRTRQDLDGQAQLNRHVRVTRRRPSPPALRRPRHYTAACAARGAPRRWDSAVRPSGRRTANARGLDGGPVKPTTSVSTVSACRIFFRDEDRPARYGDEASFATTPSTPVG